MTPVPFFSKPPRFMQYQQVRHVANERRIGIIMAVTQRCDFYTYDVAWDIKETSWCTEDELIPETATASIGFLPSP